MSLPSLLLLHIRLSQFKDVSKFLNHSSTSISFAPIIAFYQTNVHSRDTCFFSKIRHLISMQNYAHYVLEHSEKKKNRLAIIETRMYQSQVSQLLIKRTRGRCSMAMLTESEVYVRCQ